jgi:hypothetical protein
LDSLDKLLAAYAQIGDAIPGLVQYQGTFEKYPVLATVLEDYYSDILIFHREALRVFNRSSRYSSRLLELEDFLLIRIRMGESRSLHVEDVQQQVQPNSSKPPASERTAGE